MGVLKTAVLSVLLVGAALAQYIPAGNGGAGGASGSYSAASAAISPGTSFFPPGGSLAVNTTETNVQGLVTVAGTIQNFSANLSAAPGTNKALVFTWRKNATNQVVTCTVSGASTNCTDSTHQFQVAANDLIDIQVVSSGTIASGTYTSGATVTGTTGQTCTVTPTNGGGTGTTITVALTGTNALAGGTALTVTAGGSGFTSAPTAATLGSGTATCSGTVVISTSLSGPAASVITMLWSTPGQQGPQGPAGSGTPAGTNGQIQYNNSSSFGGFTVGGDASLNTTTGVLTNTGLNGTALSGLGTGILKNTTGTGVPSIAVAADFPTLNQNTTGTAANLSGTPALPNGTTATTQTTADTSTDLATDAFVHNAISGIGGGTGNAAAIVTLAFSATPTFTCPSSTAGTVVDFQATANAPIVLTGSITSSTLSGCTAGSLLNFLFKQNATAGWTVAMPTGFDSATVHPAANVTTKLTYYYDGANGRLIGATSDAGYATCVEGSAPGANPPSGDAYSNCDSSLHLFTYLDSSGNKSTTILTPASVTSGDLASFSGTAGKTLADSGVVAANAVTATAAASAAKQICTSSGASKTCSYIDFPQVLDIPAANCNNTTAGAGWSIGSGGTVTCRAGTNNKGGFISITDTSTTFATFQIAIPEDWDSGANPYIRFQIASTDTTTGHTIIPSIQVACYKGDGSTTDDVAANAAHSLSTTTLNTTANQFWSTSNVQMNSTDMTGCVAGALMQITVGRATDTATNAEFYSATVTFPRLLTVQAN